MQLNQIADLISQPDLLRLLARKFSHQLSSNAKLDFIAGNAPEGMLPAWQLRNELTGIGSEQDNDVPYVYVRAKKKKGGHKEKITGNDTSPLFSSGHRAVVVESVADNDSFVDKVKRSAAVLREKGYQVKQAISFLPQDQQVRVQLAEENLELLAVNDLDLYQDGELVTKKVERELDALTKLRDLREKFDRQPPYQEKEADDISRMLINKGAMEIRDLASGEEPFLYSSGLWGPGYLMVKGLVGQPAVMRDFCWNLALKLKDEDFDFVIGNVTGGMIPGWQLRNFLEIVRGEKVPFVYAEGTRLLEKKGLVEGELVGNNQNHNIKQGDQALVVEELVNTAGTTTGSTLHARDLGYKARKAACVFHYKNTMALKRLERYGIDLNYLATLPQTLDIAEEEKLVKPRAVQDYRFFMEHPHQYQDKWDLEPEADGGTK